MVTKVLDNRYREDKSTIVSEAFVLARMQPSGKRSNATTTESPPSFSTKRRSAGDTERPRSKRTELIGLFGFAASWPEGSTLPPSTSRPGLRPGVKGLRRQPAPLGTTTGLGEGRKRLSACSFS